MARPKSISDKELLDAARQVFIRQGIAVPTKEIARYAGISEGVLYQRFATKEDLFFAAMIPPAGDLAELLGETHLQGRERMEKITLALAGYFREAVPTLIPLVSHPGFRFEEFAGRHPDSPLFQLRGQLMELVVREQGAGRIGPVSAGAAALLIWSTAFSIAFFEHLGAHGGRFSEGMIDAAIDCLWRGLAPVPETDGEGETA